jgi:hypothetical protein
LIDPSALRAAKALLVEYMAWGDSGSGGSGAPAGSGYTKIYPSAYAFAALKDDGSIKVWGDSRFGGTGAPTDKVIHLRKTQRINTHNLNFC